MCVHGGAHGKVREVQLQVAVQFLLETWRVFFFAAAALFFHFYGRNRLD